MRIVVTVSAPHYALMSQHAYDHVHSYDDMCFVVHFVAMRSYICRYSVGIASALPCARFPRQALYLCIVAMTGV